MYDAKARRLLVLFDLVLVFGLLVAFGYGAPAATAWAVASGFATWILARTLNRTCRVDRRWNRWRAGLVLGGSILVMALAGDPDHPWLSVLMAMIGVLVIVEALRARRLSKEDA